MNSVKLNTLTQDQQKLVAAIRQHGYIDNHGHDRTPREYKGKLAIFQKENQPYQWVVPVFEHTVASINPIEFQSENGIPHLQTGSIGGLFSYGEFQSIGKCWFIDESED